MTLIDRALAEKLNSIIGAGLVSGMGSPKPGQVCIEAAIRLALGEEHSDQPNCVGDVDRELSIALNDKIWSSPMARAIGMRRLGIAQLGSSSLIPIQRKIWRAHIKIELVRQIVPIALRAAASCHPQQKHRDALNCSADRCEQVSAANATYAAANAANAAYAAAYAAYAANAAYATYAATNAANAAYATNAANAATYAANAANAANAAKRRDQILTMTCEIAVQAYVKVGCEGAKFLESSAVELTQPDVK